MIYACSTNDKASCSTCENCKKVEKENNDLKVLLQESKKWKEKRKCASW